MKNPLLDNKIKCWLYIIAAGAAAMIYSFSIGIIIELPSDCILMDALVAGAIFASETAFLWNILKYGSPSPGHPYYRFLYIAIMGIVLTGISIGGEVLLFYYYFPELMGIFITTIFIRIFVMLLIYSICAAYYTSKIRNLDMADDEPVQETAIPSVAEEILERVTIKTPSGIKVFPVSEIQFLKAEGDYVSIHTAEGQYLKEQTMKYMDAHLPGEYFVRVHRSFIINTSALKRIERYGQQHLVELKNGDKIKLSPTGYKILKEKLNL